MSDSSIQHKAKFLLLGDPKGGLLVVYGNRTSGYKPLVRDCDDPYANFQRIRTTKPKDDSANNNTI